MSALANLAASPATKVLGLEHENKYVKETFLFFYVVSVVQGVRHNENLVHTLAVALLRAFGSYGFLLPLGLGALPSKTYLHFDSYLTTLVAAVFFVHVILDRFIPFEFHRYLEKPIELAYAIIKANACGHGFVMTAGVLPDSQFAPFVGAFVAVNGHRILEHGVNGLSVPFGFDGDFLLGMIGGPLYWALVTHAGCAPVLARVVLLLFRLSCDYVDYNQVIDNVTGAVSNIGGGRKKAAPAPRGRSRTPKRK
jgi:hypothetical protein